MPIPEDAFTCPEGLLTRELGAPVVVGSIHLNTRDPGPQKLARVAIWLDTMPWGADWRAWLYIEGHEDFGGDPMCVPGVSALQALTLACVQVQAFVNAGAPDRSHWPVTKAAP